MKRVAVALFAIVSMILIAGCTGGGGPRMTTTGCIFDRYNITQEDLYWATTCLGQPEKYGGYIQTFNGEKCCVMTEIKNIYGATEAVCLTPDCRVLGNTSESECKDNPMWDNYDLCMAHKTFDTSYCEKLTDDISKNECWRDIAMLTVNPSLCDKIIPMELYSKDGCYIYIAGNTGRADICDLISVRGEDYSTCIIVAAMESNNCVLCEKIPESAVDSKEFCLTECQE